MWGLTVVDLEVVDAQTLEDGHALLQHVQGLTQLCVRCAVHPAHLQSRTVSHMDSLGWGANRTRLVPHLDVVVP